MVLLMSLVRCRPLLPLLQRFSSNQLLHWAVPMDGGVWPRRRLKAVPGVSAGLAREIDARPKALPRRGSQSGSRRSPSGDPSCAGRLRFRFRSLVLPS